MNENFDTYLQKLIEEKYADLFLALRSSVIELKFKKVDGEERIMYCTLASAIIPETKGINKRKNFSSLAVWDVNKKDWRSFKLENIIEWKYSPFSSFSLNEGTQAKNEDLGDSSNP